MSRLLLLSIPGLRARDLDSMPRTSQLFAQGNRLPLVPSFPCVTWHVQANLLTGKSAAEHGVVGNGFYWRDRDEIEMWTAWNDKITAPQIWDRLKSARPQLTSAVWFPMLSKGCSADYICMPAPIHNPDGSESLWCYTRPTELYGELRDALGHFPLQNFWGPLASLPSSQWIVDSAVIAARRFQPDFFYIYLPHLDYAAQRDGPDSPAAAHAVGQLDQLVDQLVGEFRAAYGDPIEWLVVSEYPIGPVDHVVYPNRVLRKAGLLAVRDSERGELIDTSHSPAWSLADHQFSHVFVRDPRPSQIAAVRQLFREQTGIAEVLAGSERRKYGLDHPRAGEVVLVSESNSWQAYYYWMDDRQAPDFARTVDIHRKPGYDPVELFWDPQTQGIPLNAELVKGSHGSPLTAQTSQAVVISSEADWLGTAPLTDRDLAALIFHRMGV